MSGSLPAKMKTFMPTSEITRTASRRQHEIISTNGRSRNYPARCADDLVDLKVKDGSKSSYNQDLSNKAINTMRSWIIVAAVLAIILGILIFRLISANL